MTFTYKKYFCLHLQMSEESEAHANHKKNNSRTSIIIFAVHLGLCHWVAMVCIAHLIPWKNETVNSKKRGKRIGICTARVPLGQASSVPLNEWKWKWNER